MRFSQLDRITEIVPGKRLVAIRGLTMAEEYLQDHFPRFPVMPGVLMLEAMFQAGMWLVQATEDFEYSCVVLSQANQIKFHDFVEPGVQLTVSAEWKKSENEFVEVQCRGDIGDHVAVRGRLVLERYNLADRGLAGEETDRFLICKNRRFLRLLQDPRNPFEPSQKSLNHSELVAGRQK